MLCQYQFAEERENSPKQLEKAHGLACDHWSTSSNLNLTLRQLPEVSTPQTCWALLLPNVPTAWQAAFVFQDNSEFISYMISLVSSQLGTHRRLSKASFPNLFHPLTEEIRSESPNKWTTSPRELVALPSHPQAVQGELLSMSGFRPLQNRLWSAETGAERWWHGRMTTHCLQTNSTPAAPFTYM